MLTAINIQTTGWAIGLLFLDIHIEQFLPYLPDRLNPEYCSGTANTLSVQLAETIQKLMPRAELMRFSSTGSEATMYSVRLARAATGKRVIAKVIGGWHGFNTTLLQTVNYPFEFDESLGLIQEEEQFVESIPFNDLDRSLKILETRKDDLAGIIIEPVLGASGCIPATRDYLMGLQEFAKKNSSLFILDEIVTGFRISIHGAMSEYNLEPDLFTLGKIIGGGMPVGLVCGSKRDNVACRPYHKRSKIQAMFNRRWDIFS